MDNRFGPDIKINNAAFIHDTALLYGKIRIDSDVSIWAHAVMRAEIYEIEIGARTNIQDFVMVHVGNNTPTIIGEDCSITHHATIHGCTIGDRCLIGINATIMDGAEIGNNSIVAGHSIVTEGTKFPDNSVIAGTPARRIKEVDNSEKNLLNARFYRQNALNYAKGIHRFSDEQIARLMSGE